MRNQKQDENLLKEMKIMNKTKTQKTDYKIMVDIKGLQDMLSCGRTSADQIGESAGAVTRIGRRKLYNVSKIERYLEGHSYIEL